MNDIVTPPVGGQVPADPAAPAAPAAPAPWFGTASEDNAAYIANKGWTNTDEMVSSYHNLEKFAGGSKNLLELPGADATPEQMANVYTALGRPDSAEAYGFEAAEGADPALDSWFREASHAAGLNETQAKQFYASYGEIVPQIMEARETAAAEQSEADLTKLKSELGAEFDVKVGQGKQVVGGLGYDEATLTAMESSLGTYQFMKLMTDLGSKMGEDNFADGSESASSFGVNAAQAKQQIAELNSDAAFMDKYISGDKAALAKMTRLNEVAYAAG